MTPQPSPDLAALSELLEKAGYEVTSDGKVFSLSGWRGHSKRELRQHLNKDGYPCVRLLIDGRPRRYFVHRLVAEVHICPRPHAIFQVRHLDGTRTNNDKSNLLWGSPAANAHDRKIHGREKAAENGRLSAAKISGERSHLSKLSADEVRAIRNRAQAGEGATSIAKSYPRVTMFNIAKILEGKTWKNVA